MNFEKYYIDIDDSFSYDVFWKRFQTEFADTKKQKQTILSAYNQLESYFAEVRKFEFDFQTTFPECNNVLTEARNEYNKYDESTILKLDRFFNKHYKDLYYDEVQDVNYHTLNKKLKELDIETMFLRMKNEGLLSGISEKDVLRYLRSPETIHHRNPIREYFETLPKWNGADHAKRYISLFDVRENIPGICRTDFITSQYKKYLIRSISQALGDHTMDNINKCSLVFLSEKNTGKTTFITEKQFPAKLREFFTQSFTFDRKDNNALSTICSQFIVFIDEFNGFANQTYNVSKKGVNEFKMFTGNNTFTIMKKGHKDVRPRIASFIFASNPQTFGIYDDSLLNRFIILDFANTTENKLPFHLWNEKDTELLWAQIYHLYKNGDTGLMSNQEDALNARINETYKAKAIVDLRSLVSLHIKPGTRFEGQNYTSTELVNLLLKSNAIPETIKVQITARGVGRLIKNMLQVPKIKDRTKKTEKAYRLIVKL